MMTNFPIKHSIIKNSLFLRTNTERYTFIYNTLKDNYFNGNGEIISTTKFTSMTDKKNCYSNPKLLYTNCNRPNKRNPREFI